jgi:signal transduction histidine kinase
MIKETDLQAVVRVCLIDDDEEDFLITSRLLSKIPDRKYEVSWIPSYENARAEIYKSNFDIFLIDYRLGIHSGLELINEANANGVRFPMILLTGQGDFEIDVQAMKAGASDYLVKGTFNHDYLDRAIRYSIGHAKSMSEITKLNVMLEKRVEARTQEIEEAINQLEKTNKNLEREVKERIKAEQKIQAAFQKEKELNELKSRFVSMASHEFRTPLSTILSSASLIARYTEKADEEKRTKHVNRIMSSVNHLTDMLNDLLSLGKLEEGMVKINVSEINIPEFSLDVNNEMMVASRQGQNINYTHFGPAIFKTDKQLLRNIMLNLLSNALKYSSDFQEIDFSSRIEEGNLKISVKDYGLGIPETDKKHLFERFFRASNVTNIQGTGLGLNIVKKYIEVLGGQITFESDYEKGTEFLIIIPEQKNFSISK